MNPIEPKKITLRLCGHDVEITINQTSHPQELASKFSGIIDCFGFEEIEDDICQNNEMHGDFTVWEYITIEDETVQLELTGEWRILCDFTLFRRIFSWWYNHYTTEALTEEMFKEAYGPAKGSHYFSKWRYFKRDIMNMVGYLGSNVPEGRLFMDMIMSKVIEYENRINQNNLNSNENNSIN